MINKRRSDKTDSNPPDPNDKLIFSLYACVIHFADNSSYCEMWTKQYDSMGSLTFESRSACRHNSDGTTSMVPETEFSH